MLCPRFIGVDLLEVIGKLTLPALRRLQIPDVAFDSDLIDHVHSLISRSGCNLKKLYLSQSILEGPARVAMYRAAFPSVPTLVSECVEDANARLFVHNAWDSEEVLHDKS